MAEQERFDRLDEALDEAINAILADRREGLALADPELATLLVLAGDLRDLPDPRFKERLKAELIPQGKEDSMTTLATTTTTTTITPPARLKPGFHSITPYLVVNGAAELIAFYERAFGAREQLRVPRPDGTIMHAEVMIGDSVIELGDASAEWGALELAFHLYLEDADAVYARALAAGATSLSEPVDQPYGDREAGIADPAGNHWYIATHLEDVAEEEVGRRFASGQAITLPRDRGIPPRPQGFRTVTPGLRVAGTARLIELLKTAFGAEELSRTAGPDGSIIHAELRIGDSILEAGDPHGPWGPMPGALHFYVDDVDAVYERALAAGATSRYGPTDMPYGERGAAVVDAFGNQWFIATLL